MGLILLTDLTELNLFYNDWQISCTIYINISRWRWGGGVIDVGGKGGKHTYPSDHYTFSHTTSQDGTWVAAGEFIVQYATWTSIYSILNRLMNENKKGLCSIEKTAFEAS